MPVLKRTMFREYDIRGRESDDELNDNSIYYIGRGFCKFLINRNIEEVVVGHDAEVPLKVFMQMSLRA